MLLGRNVKLANYCDFSHANQKFLVTLSPWLHLFGHAATLAKPSMQFCAGGWIGISSVLQFFLSQNGFYQANIVVFGTETMTRKPDDIAECNLLMYLRSTLEVVVTV